MDMDVKLYLKKKEFDIWCYLDGIQERKNTIFFQNPLADGSVKLFYIYDTYIYIYIYKYYMVYKVYMIFVNLKHDLLRCVCVCRSSFHDLLLEVRWLPFKAQV